MQRGEKEGSMKEYLKSLVEKFSSFKILVIGDAILDTYINGITDRLSREAPVPIINVQNKVHECGGAANTAINVSALGAHTFFLTVIGRDASGKELMDVLKKNRVETECIIRDKSRVTLSKKRVRAFSNILLRMDEGDTLPINEATEKELIEKLKKIYRMVDAIILSDYGYGIMTDSVIQCLKKLQEKNPKTLIVDSKDLRKFKSLNPNAVKPNYEETIKLLKLPKLQGSERVKQILENGRKLQEITGAENIAATMDTEGTILFQKGKKPFKVDAVPHDNKNSIGAGDTFISALTLSFTAKGLSQACVQVASSAAEIVLRKEGTGVCTLNELKAFFNENPKYISNISDLSKKVEQLKKEGRKIVFANGCFDILHKGHVNLLNRAKSFGEVLIVGINSDESIKRLKGKERPINCLDDRITVLAGLQSVDLLVSFEEDSPVRLIKVLKPDVFVKGGDYTTESIPEAALVTQLGGTVKIIEFVNDRSTTQIIRRIREVAPVMREGLKNEKIAYAKAGGME